MSVVIRPGSGGRLLTGIAVRDVLRAYELMRNVFNIISVVRRPWQTTLGLVSSVFRRLAVADCGSVVQYRPF